MITLAQGEKALEELISSLSEDTNFNESQTRFHVIDKILFECLGWDRESEVEVEHAESQKFTDYEFGHPQRLAILEAKREGTVFLLPAGVSTSLMTDVQSIRRFGGDVKMAIDQIQEYCALRGTPVAIITNGHQFIAFLGSRQDGVSVHEGKAIVFNDLSVLKSHFQLAWQMLSAEGLRERNINRYLISGDSSLPNKISSRLQNYPRARYPSDIQSTLRSLSDLFIQDLIYHSDVEHEFFSECYCVSGALSQYALLSKNILEARYASLFNESEPHPFLSSVRGKKGDNLSPDILSEAVARRPIVLLGDVGVGKTSFIKNLMYNSAHEEFKNAIYVYIDLGATAALSEDLKIYVINEIERQLNDKYDLDVYEYNLLKGVYASEIHRFSKSIWGSKKESDPDLYQTKLGEKFEELIAEKDQHLKRVTEYYSKSSRKQLIIALDNADQRDFDVQQSTFVISQELAQEWGATVFVSVRPQTFFRSKRSGALTAYPHKVFTISPPRIDQVIEKRLIFALKMAEGKVSADIYRGFQVNAGNLALFLKALISSLTKNRELLEFLSNITGGNIRAAIEFVTGFIGSPNIDAVKIIDTMEKKGGYRIPLHEFTKQALLGEYSHYSPNTSIAMNMFDVTCSDSNEHFLVPILLAFLNLEGKHRDNDGFCKSIDLFSELQGMGFTGDQIEKALRRSTNKKLIETSQRITFEEDVNGLLIGELPDYFRITTIGVYHLSRWIGHFTYLDAMVFDTPILNDAARSELLKNIESFAIDVRYHRALVFKEYLLSAWGEFTQAPRYFDIKSLFKDNDHGFDNVARAIKYNSVDREK